MFPRQKEVGIGALVVAFLGLVLVLVPWGEEAPERERPGVIVHGVGETPKPVSLPRIEDVVPRSKTVGTTPPAEHKVAGPQRSPEVVVRGRKHLPDYAAAPEQTLAKQLGLTPKEAERVGEVLRKAEAELEAELLRISKNGYDDVAARHACDRYTASLPQRVERVLPPAKVPLFRKLIAAEKRR